MKLTIKQKKFADEYIISGNATESYKRAGYAWKTEGGANSNASDLLRNHKVSAYIEKRMAEMDEQAIAKQEEVLKYLTAIMRGEEREQTLIGKGMGHQSIIAIDVSAKDRIKAAELLGKRYAMWTDKIEQTEPISITIKRKDAN